MKIYQLVDDFVVNFEAARAVNFADLARKAHLQAEFSQLQSQCPYYYNKNH